MRIAVCGGGNERGGGRSRRAPERLVNLVAPKNQLSAAEQQPAGVGVAIKSEKREERKKSSRESRWYA